VGEGIPQRQLSVGDLQLGFEEGKPPFDMTGTLKAPEVKFPQLHPRSPRPSFIWTDSYPAALLSNGKSCLQKDGSSDGN
jgi:hypothetical protein